MKLRTLLFLLLITGFLNAQEPYRSLIISEVRLGQPTYTHIELTNMGDKTINLGEFRFAQIRPWMPSAIFDVYNDIWIPEQQRQFMLPDYDLAPGESFVIATAYDFGPRMYEKRIDGFEGYERVNQEDLYELADFLIHIGENNTDLYANVKDSITADEEFSDNYQWTMYNFFGRAGYYIEHHFAEGDSAVVDQVNGVFDNNGKNFATGYYDVAGVQGATGNSLLARKFSVKTGNLDFANARGVGLDDSEWMPVTYPEGYDQWRDLWWTVGNHDNYILDGNTLESDVIDIDFAGKTLTVPWGIRRLDGIMRQMKKKPGIAWSYHLNSNVNDSLYRSVKTGDQLTIYVLGNDLQTATFDIVVDEPTANDNIVVPIAHKNVDKGPIINNAQSGILGWPRVTNHQTGEDTITGSWYGLPYALRTDTLLKYLEMPSNASWEFVWIDGVKRADIKDGDKLKVIAESGNEKEYYLQVGSYNPSHNANLSSITWPDIPDFYKGIFGWIGDTIPNFSPSTFNYNIQVPLDADGIPALVAKTANLNAKVEVKRASSLNGTPKDRSIEFHVTAEDDSVQNTYVVELQKEKKLEDLQPYYAEPFLSQLIFLNDWSNNYVEICNPGNQPLDLSNYMFIWFGVNPGDAIQSIMQPNRWWQRWLKYVPGYKWVGQSDWIITPGVLEPDLNVNSIVHPGDVFVMGQIKQDRKVAQAPDDYVWPIPNQIDVSFSNYEGQRGTYKNPWNQTFPLAHTVAGRGYGNNWFMFKILNDSIKRGLKPANDPNDFKLIESFGMADGSRHVIGGKLFAPQQSWTRKPEIYKGNPVTQASFGTNPDDSEWTYTDPDYWWAQGIRNPWHVLNVALDIGQHYFIEPSHYKSTISSVTYKVSEGYESPQQIRGLTTGTIVTDFLGNIIKKNEGQSLMLKSTVDGSELGMDAVLSLNDTLVVISADSTNVTKYVLEVSDNGLSSNALLTSNRYTIEVTDNPLVVSDDSGALEINAGSGKITGLEYGTTLKTILNNVTVPMGASLTVIDSEGAYVPLNTLNFDVSNVSVTVTHDQFFEVIAEDGVTTIVYQLSPQASASSAFLTSDVYSVVQRDLLVKLIPRGTAVPSFLKNVTPSLGATVKVIDKFGLERTEGIIVQDDRAVVTSPDGTVQTVYYFSMLPTEYISETTYLAYITSNIYAVDQLGMQISGASGSTELSTFLNRINAAPGATVFVVDNDGNAKISGNLDDGDVLKVVSADGVFEVQYTLNLDLTSADLTNIQTIGIYPNPTTGKLNIRGIESGNRIQVFNSIGTSIYDLNARGNVETISLNEQPSGMYLIVISDNSSLLARFKAVRK